MTPSRAALSVALLAALAFAAPAAARAEVVERFDTDPLAPARPNVFFAEGDVAARFVYLPGTPPAFPADREGTLRALYDTTVPTARLGTPIGRVLSLDEDFAFGAILTIRSAGFAASPDGFSQIGFGLWNDATTGLDRTGFPSDAFDSVEFDYFANLTQFGGPFLSPSVFGGDNGSGNAFFNFAFQSVETALPADVPLLCHFEYAATTRRIVLTVARHRSGVAFERIAGGTVGVDLSGLDPAFLVNMAGIAAYFEGWPSLHAEVDYDLLYVGPVPAPYGIVARRRPIGPQAGPPPG